jgi:hypothetical protein
MNRRATTSALILSVALCAACDKYECVPPGCEPCFEPKCDCVCPCPAPVPAGVDACDTRAETRTSNDLAAELRSGDRVAREQAIDALARMGPIVLPDLEPLLSDPDPTVRFSALQVLVRLRQEAWPSVWYVKNRLSDSDAAIRADAAYVIGMTGTHAADAIPELICALNDWSPNVRYQAARAFQRMDRHGEPGLKALERAAKCDRDPRVREAAQCAIYLIEKALCHAPEQRY